MPARALLILTACTAAALALLIGLGVWQLQRLQWKEGLIAAIEARTKAEPVTLEEAIARVNRGEDIEYLRVAATGTFDHAIRLYLYATADGVVGWHVIAPLTGRDGNTVLIDRGFVPDESKDRIELPAGVVTVTGLARAPEKHGSFIPNNEPERNRWFWRDLAGMRSAMRLQGTVAPFFLDAERSGAEGVWPQGGQTRLDIPNDHLQYAITWFLLALALFVIYAIYVLDRLRGGHEVAGRGGDG